MSTITICSSANFYKKAVEIQEELQKAGLNVIVPAMASAMKESGDFDVSHYKTWQADASDYDKKADLMRGHFARVAEGDSILVLNYEKNGKQNYIGGNVLMEMALAFYLGKPIYLVNEAPTDSTYLEEILGMQPTILHGDAGKLVSLLATE